MDLNHIILFSVIIMFSYFIEGLIGFGGTILALPLASAILGIRVTVPVLTIVVLIASLFIAIRDRKYIDKKEFIKISTIMALGLPLGMVLFSILPEKPLKIVLGIFMVIVGIKGLVNMYKLKKGLVKYTKHEPTKLELFIEKTTLFCGGIVHGAFTSGGPFVVVYATKNIKNKTSFRATLCALWAALNTLMLSINIYRGDITTEIVSVAGITMMFVVISLWVSNILHKKLKSDSFSKFVYIALCLSGVLMTQ